MVSTKEGVEKSMFEGGVAMEILKSLRFEGAWL
jgi:hypothetical protein